MEMMPLLGLGKPDMVSASYSDRTGMVEVTWTWAATASGYIIIIIAINVNDISGDVVAVPLNDGDLETWSVGGLTAGETYDVYVAATGSGGRFHALRGGACNCEMIGTGRQHLSSIGGIA